MIVQIIGWVAVAWAILCFLRMLNRQEPIDTKDVTAMGVFLVAAAICFK